LRRCTRHRRRDGDPVPAVRAVPPVDVALRRLSDRRRASQSIAVASGRSELVDDLVAGGRQRHSDDVRRTVGDLDAGVACSAAWTALAVGH